MTDRTEIALNEAGLEAAVRECARITAPTVSDKMFAQEKACKSRRYLNTREEMARTIRAYLAEGGGVKGEPETVAWRDDPTSDERWNAGCDFAMTQLCKALDVDPDTVNWDAATETVDGDVQSVIWNILRTRMGEDWDPDTAPPADVGMRKALEPFARIADLYSDHDDDDLRIFADMDLDAIKLLTVGACRKARAALTAPGGTTKSDAPLGRFGHHPIPADDFLVEVECIENEWSNIKVGFTNGTPTRDELERRLFRAMRFRVGGDAACIDAKTALRKVEKEMRAASDPSPIRSDEPDDRERDYVRYGLREEDLP